MADIIDTLHPQNDLETNLYPNIVPQNIPTGAVSKDKLAQIVQNQIDNPVPQDGTITIAKLASDVINRLNNPTIPSNYVGESQLTTAVQSKLNNPPIPDDYVGLTKLTSEVRSLLSADWSSKSWTSISNIGTGIYKIDGYLRLNVYVSGTGSTSSITHTLKNAIVKITSYHTEGGSTGESSKYASLYYQYIISGRDTSETGWSSEISMVTSSISTRGASTAEYLYEGSFVKLA